MVISKPQRLNSMFMLAGRAVWPFEGDLVHTTLELNKEPRGNYVFRLCGMERWTDRDGVRMTALPTNCLFCLGERHVIKNG